MSGDQIVIVGAGPAGMEAALTLVKSGLRPIVVDASARSGGQIYRRAPAAHTRSYKAIYGADASKARHVHDAFDAICEKIDYRPNTQVWAAHDSAVFLDGPAGREVLPYDKLILCTGATDRVFPIPGWETPGCYTLGGAQIALKSQALALGDPIGFVGAGPLLWLVAWQHLRAGADVAGVWCTSSFKDLAFAFPWLALRPRLALRGVGQILALWRAGIPVKFGARPVAVTADADGQVSGLKWSAGRKTHYTPLQALALGWHLRSETQLSQLLELPSIRGQHRPMIDGAGRSPVQGVYFAGDGADILGADAARTSGRMAATALLNDLGHQQTPRDILGSILTRLQHARLRAFAKGLARAFPPLSDKHHLALSEDTVVCRCENVSLSAVRAAAENWKCEDINRIKAMTRAGMGRCQGRYCGATLSEIVAAQTGRASSDIPAHRAQAPIYPLSITSEKR
ncbi:MAG: NAD(P)/FAD-dependent oxidoreductase [Pseudomonadota bacterium]